MIGSSEDMPVASTSSRNKKMILAAVGVAATMGFFGMVANT